MSVPRNEISKICICYMFLLSNIFLNSFRYESYFKSDWWRFGSLLHTFKHLLSVNLKNVWFWYTIECQSVIMQGMHEPKDLLNILMLNNNSTYLHSSFYANTSYLRNSTDGRKGLCEKTKLCIQIYVSIKYLDNYVVIRYNNIE